MKNLLKPIVVILLLAVQNLQGQHSLGKAYSNQYRHEHRPTKWRLLS